MGDRTTLRPPNVVTYFGDYASAIAEGDPYSVHIFLDGDEITFCNLPPSVVLAYGTPQVIGAWGRRQCDRCFALAQEARRDV